MPLPHFPRLTFLTVVGITLWLGVTSHAQARMGRLCSIAYQDKWSANLTNSEKSDPCAKAHANLKQILEREGIDNPFGTGKPPFDFYVQSFFDLDANNTAIVTCENNGVEVQHVTQGTGAAPIVEASQHAKNNGWQRCRFEVKEDLANQRHPIADRSMLGYCAYGNEDDKFVMRVANEGFGRDAACNAAKDEMEGRRIVYQSAGYILAAGVSKISYHCSIGPHNLGNVAYVSHLNDMIRFREWLESQQARRCIITTDALGHYGYGNWFVKIAPGFEHPSGQDDQTINPPTVEAVAETLDQSIEDFAKDFEQAQNQEEVTDLPEIEIDKETGVASIKTPLPPKDQTELADQRRRPPGKTERGTTTNGVVNTEKDSANSWTYGNDLLGLTVGYETGAPQWHTLNASAYMNGSVFYKPYNILSLKGKTGWFRRGNEQGVEAVITSKVLKKTTEILNKKYSRNGDYLIPKTALLKSTLFATEQQFMVGPVPVIAKLSVVGEVGYVSTGVVMSRPGQGNLQTLSLSSYPYGAIDAVGSAGVGVPVANAGLMGEVAFVDGSLYAKVIGRVDAGQRPPDTSACVVTGVNKMSLLTGKLSAYYSIQEPSTEYVKKIVAVGCRNVRRYLGFLTQLTRVCDRTESVLEEVTSYTRFFHKRTQYDWDGYSFGEGHIWYNTCGR